MHTVKDFILEAMLILRVLFSFTRRKKPTSGKGLEAEIIGRDLLFYRGFQES